MDHKQHYGMDVRAPRPKKPRNFFRNQELPPPKLPPQGAKGVFNGVCVQLTHAPGDFVKRGFFGKGNLSRSDPQFGVSTPILRQRQWDKRKLFGVKTNQSKKVLVLPDSDPEAPEDYFKDITPKWELDHSNLSETINLMLEEAYFLSLLDLLDVFEGEVLLKPPALWTKFCEAEPHFPRQYVVYHHFRALNWVVKPGLKFGGTFLLYKEGPPFYHASYVVVIEEDDPLKIMGLNRLSETTGKELLLVKVTTPVNVSNFEGTDFTNFRVDVTKINRWVSGAERNALINRNK